MKPNYVLCNNGKSYRDPRWERRDWYIQWEDGTFVIAIVKRVEHFEIEAAKQSAINILNGVGIRANIRMNSFLANEKRSFPSGFKSSVKFDIDILENPPPPMKYTAIREPEPLIESNKE